MSRSGDIEIKDDNVARDHNYEFDAPQYVDFAELRNSGGVVLHSEKGGRELEGNCKKSSVSFQEGDASTAAESTVQDVETIGSPSDSMLEIIRGEDRNSTTMNYANGGSNSLNESACDRDDKIGSPPDSMLEIIQSQCDSTANLQLSDHEKGSETKSAGAGDLDDNYSISRMLSSPVRTEDGRIIPKPFAFHQTLGCHGHEKRQNCETSYVPLAVALKAFESTRSLPYDPPKSRTSYSLPRKPTRPRSPILLTKLRHRSNSTLPKSSEELEFSMISSFKPFKAKPVDLKILSSERKVCDTSRTKTSTTPVPFNLPGDRISSLKRERFANYLRNLEEEEKKARIFRARPLPSCIATNSSSRSDELSSSLSGTDAKYAIYRVSSLGRPPSSIASPLSSSDYLTSKTFHATPVPNFSKIFIPKKSDRKPTQPTDTVLRTELRSKERTLYHIRKSLEGSTSIPNIRNKELHHSVPVSTDGLMEV